MKKNCNKWFQISLIVKKDEEDFGNRVKVLSGIFKGIKGKFLHADPDADEWTVELELFGVEVKVVFQREELQFI